MVVVVVVVVVCVWCVGGWGGEGGGNQQNIAKQKEHVATWEFKMMPPTTTTTTVRIPAALRGQAATGELGGEPVDCAHPGPLQHHERGDRYHQCPPLPQ